jgi:uncharacterized alpha-E superfamily protein
MLDSVMTYRSRYSSRFKLGPVLDLVICDTTNPRSVAYQLAECVAHVEQLRAGTRATTGPADEGLAAKLLETICSVEIVRISNDFETGTRGPLNKLLGDIDATLPAFSDVISHRYFFHSGPIQRLAEILRK